MKKKLLIICLMLLVISCLALASCELVPPTSMQLIVDGEVYQTISVTGGQLDLSNIQPVRDGYTFEGWYIDESLTIPLTTDNASQALVGGKLYSKWSKTATTECQHANAEWQTTLEPTCTQPGSKHKVCPSCNEELQVEAIPATGHSFGEWTTVVESTCTQKGQEERTCSCGEKETRDKQLADHTFGDWTMAKAATCTEAGVMERSCSCGEKETSAIKPTGHTEETLPAVDATCTTTGLTEGTKCSVCGTVIVAQQVVGTINHNYVDGKCTVCKLVDPAVCTHNVGDWIVDTPATCTTEGSKHIECTLCKTVLQTETIPATDHNYTSVVTPPTCTEQGYTTHTCECGDSYVDAYVDALDHDWNDGEITTPATCTETGVKTYTCTRSGCGQTKTEVVDALDHDEVTHEAQEPTCTEIGWDAYVTCTHCDYTTYKEIPAKDHNHIAVITRPTCTEQGFTTHTCNCGDEYVDNYVDAKGHNYENSVCSNCGESGIEFKLSSDETYYIVIGLKDDCPDRNIVIPPTYNDLPVTSIGDSAFYDYYSIESVIIPEGVTSIGKYAFYDAFTVADSTSITIPSSVTSIGDYAFEACYHLNKVEISDLTSWCNIDFANISSNPLISIVSLCLDGEEVTDLVIPADVTRIKDYAFCGYYSLTSITIPDSVTSIGEDAFALPHYYSAIEYRSLVSQLASVTFEKDSKCTSIGDGAFAGCTSLESITIPSSVTSIGTFAFEECDSLTSIIIPEGVTSIGSYAFDECSNLNSITIPSSVTSIGDSAFEYCYSLEKVEISDLASWCNIDFESYDSVPLYYAERLYLNGEEVTKLVIPEGVTSIGDRAFSYCNSITSVTIPASVTSIGDSAFNECDSLTSIIIPKDVTWIGSFAFAYCDNLTTVTFEENSKLKNIKDGTFCRCTSLESVIFGEGSQLETIGGSDALQFITGSGAFAYCYRLTSITIPSGVTSIIRDAFASCYSLIEVCNKSSLNITAGDNWGKGYVGAYAKHIITDEADSYLTNIDDFIFYDDGTDVYLVKYVGDDEEVTLPGYNGKDYEIYKYAFYKNYQITRITIPEGVTSIEDYAFYDCNGLISITIPEGVRSIGSYAFYGCSSLESIIIPSSLTSIGYQAFYDSAPTTVCYEGTEEQWKNIDVKSGNQTFTGCTICYNFTNIDGFIIGDTVLLAYHGYETNIIIPNSVTSIGDSAFQDCDFLTSVIFEENSLCTNIDFDAFKNCTSLESIIIPSGVTWISYKAFYGCTSLTSITIPSSVTIIGNYAFYGCTSLESITIPSSVTYMGDYAFYGCDSLTSITIPSSVTSIGSYAFSGCTSLTSVVFGESSQLTEIGDYAFYGCSNLTSITIPSGVTSMGKYAFDFCYSLTSVVFEEGGQLTRMHYGMFRDCTNLESITLPFVGATLNGTSGTHFGYIFGAEKCWDNADCVPSSLKAVVITGGTSIKRYAFYGCSNLTSITIPDSVTWIGQGAFEGCTSLESITLPFVDDIPFSYIFGADSSSSNANYIPTSLKTVVITGGTSIGDDVFAGCTSLESITIPGSVTSIGEDAFSGCNSLRKVHISDLVSWCNIDFYDQNANPLYYAQHLYLNGEEVTELVIPEGVTSIGNNAFCNCCSLISITIPSSVTSIGQYAFSRCYNLVEVCDKSPELTISAGSYNNGYIGFHAKHIITDEVDTFLKNVDDYIFYDDGTDVYLVKYVGDDEEVTLPGYNGKDYVIYQYAFCNNDKITKVILSSSVTSIDDCVFYNCDSLTSITIPEGVTSIGSYAFSGCESLTNITIPSSVTSIGSSAFARCYSLTSITIQEGVTSIGSSAFIDCTSLKNITIPSSVTSIGWYAFEDCSSLTSITILDGVTSIGKDAFSGCSNLNKVEISDLASWCNIDFYNKYANPLYYAKHLYLNGEEVTELVIPNGVTSIGDYAFYNCDSFTSIIIPEGVTSIGDSAFAYCDNISSITIPSSVTSIGYKAFYGCTILRSVEFVDPNGWYYTSTEGATGGTSLTLTDSSQNAKYLKSTYYNYYWYKKN